MLVLISIICAIIVLIALLGICYRKVGPNQVLIITGGLLNGPYLVNVPETNTKVKVVKGGGTWVWPIIQQAEVESLDTFTIDVEVQNVMTKDAVKVNAKANVVLRVGGDKKSIAIASEKILGLNEQERNQQMYLVTKGAVRDTLSQMTPKDAYNREQFATNVKAACEPIFNNMGLEITSMSITDIWDDNGYYDSLSAADIAQKKAEAAKAKAEADRDARIAQAEANTAAKTAEAENDQKTSIAQIEADNKIAEKTKELNVNKAKYDEEVRRQQAIANKAQDIASAEQDAILQEKQIIVKQNQLKATVIAQTNADKEKKQLEADAQAYSINKQADADAYAIKVKGEADASSITQVGQAKANAQLASAKALQQNGDKALQNKIIDIMPELVAKSAEPYKTIKELTVLNGAQGMQDLSTASLKQAMMVIKNTTGLDLADIINKRADGQTTISGHVPTDNN